MRTLEDALNQFAYHPATPEVSKKYARMRQRVMDLAINAWDDIPDGPEKTLAFRGLQQFLMHANLAIALTTPADLETPDVARVLPHGDVALGHAPAGEWECANCHDSYAKEFIRWNVAGVPGDVCQSCKHTFDAKRLADEQRTAYDDV